MKTESASKQKALEASGRANIYSLLARFYLKEVDTELIEALKDERVRSVLKGLGADVEALSEGTGDRSLIDTLSEEYAALFIVPGSLSPYESVWVRGLLAQGPEEEVRLFYRRLGLDVSGDSFKGLLADHIGIELDFMGRLAERESEAWDMGDEKEALELRSLEAEFFNGHIGRWAFRLIDRLIKNARHPLYREIFGATKNFLEMEREEFSGE